jgi:hypothetical protein
LLGIAIYFYLKDCEEKFQISTFDKLCDYLHDKIFKRNFKKSKSTDPSIDEIIVGFGLRFPAGGKLNDIRHVYGISIATAYTCKNSFIDAVNDCPELEIKLPSSA